MFMMFQVGDREDLPPVPADFPQCGSYIPSGTDNSKISVLYLNICLVIVMYMHCIRTGQGSNC